jgi:acyl-CoA thioester hydrolase
MSFVHTERVRFGDLDAMRHLNNVVFLRYFETARIAYLRQLVPGHDPAHPEADDFGLIFAECHINYRSPVHFDEPVDVQCSIGTVRRSSFRVEFDMRVEGRLVAEGYGVLVGFDYANQQAAQLPETLRERLEREARGEETTSGGTEDSSAAAG